MHSSKARSKAVARKYGVGTQLENEALSAGAFRI